MDFGHGTKILYCRIRHIIGAPKIAFNHDEECLHQPSLVLRCKGTGRCMKSGI